MRKINIEMELPDVRVSKWKIVPYDIDRIVNSLVEETGMPQNLAREIANEVTIKLYNSGYKSLSAPLIREICNTIMIEKGLEQYRSLYTRCGMPVYDINNLFENGINENANQNFNPESIHFWTADRLKEEYALVYLIKKYELENNLKVPSLVDAHLKGDIHIHKLRFFMDRPFCANWDARMILYNGLPPGGSPHFSYAKPAKQSTVAFLHLAKWYGIIQGLYQGGQGYDNICAFLAPYARGLPDKEIEQLAQCFIYETNQIYASRAQVPFTSIDTEPGIPKPLQNVLAILPGGTIDGSIYGNYEDEAEKLFLAFNKVYRQGDGNGRLFNFPKHEIKAPREMWNKHHDAYYDAHITTAEKGDGYYLLSNQYVHSQCCRLIQDGEKLKRFCRDPKKFDWNESYMNIGSLQPISINLPRIAYLANGNDDKFFEILEERIQQCITLLMFKKQLLEKRYNTGKTELLSNQVKFPKKDEKQSLFDFDQQSCLIGFVGGNEMCKAHTGYELHEGNGAVDFMIKVLKYMINRCEYYSVEHQYNISLWEEPAESTASRFAILDVEQFKNQCYCQGKQSESYYYTNSDHIRYGADIPLSQLIQIQSQFHPIVQGGVITHIWLGESTTDPEALMKMTSRIMETPTLYFAYTFDFSQCMKCFRFMKGIFERCPDCGSENIELYSRITGYYARVRRFIKGKYQEWLDRKRYNIL